MFFFTISEYSILTELFYIKETMASKVNSVKDKNSPVCSKHSRSEILIWCQTCKLTGCKQCLSEKHRQCHWKYIEEAAEDLRSCVENETTRFYNQLEEELSFVDKDIESHRKRMKNVSRYRQAINEMENDGKEEKNKLIEMRKKIVENMTALEENITSSLDCDVATLLSRRKQLEEIWNRTQKKALGEYSFKPKYHSWSVIQVSSGYKSFCVTCFNFKLRLCFIVKTVPSVWLASIKCD